MKLNINQTPDALKWPQVIKKSFDFKNGQGLTQLNLSYLFTIKDCKNIFKNFNSNLNWIIRDSQKIKVPKNQVSTSKYLVKVMDFFRQLLQKNIIFNLKLKNIDQVQFFLPRLCIDRKLPEVNASSQLIKSSKKILSKKSI